MNAKLTSAFADRLYAFLDYKRAHGYAYNVERVIRRFDRMVGERFPDETLLTKRICAAWMEKGPNEGAGGLARRAGVIREFARFLAMGGESAYLIPASEIPKMPRKSRPCHVFDDEELAAFFAAADSLDPNPSAPLQHLSVPVYFRVLYCCGLRPKEAREIRRRDVDLRTGEVFIAESKRRKERIVSMPEDLLAIFSRYLEILEDVFPGCQWAFPNSRGTCHCNGDWTRSKFSRCWSMAGGDGFPGPKARPYDFRHTFATRRIARWMAEGRDADALLVLLMDFMGHENPKDTYYYFHLVPSAIPALSGYGSPDLADIVPEAVGYDQD